MADIKVMVSGSRKHVINVTGSFAGDGSADVDEVIIDRSTLIGPGGVLPGRIRVDEITWAVGVGYDNIAIVFDDAADEVIENLQGQGYMDYRPYSGKSMTGDPTTATEGDVRLLSTGGAAGDTYSILINCSLKN